MEFGSNTELDFRMVLEHTRRPVSLQPATEAYHGALTFYVDRGVVGAQSYSSFSSPWKIYAGTHFILPNSLRFKYRNHSPTLPWSQAECCINPEADRFEELLGGHVMARQALAPASL